MYEWLTIAADPATMAAYEKERGTRFTAADREMVLRCFRNLQERAEHGEDLSWLKGAVRCETDEERELIRLYREHPDLQGEIWRLVFAALERHNQRQASKTS